jgi:hypothetical protein
MKQNYSFISKGECNFGYFLCFMLFSHALRGRRHACNLRLRNYFNIGKLPLFLVQAAIMSRDSTVEQLVINHQIKIEKLNSNYVADCRDFEKKNSVKQVT